MNTACEHEPELPNIAIMMVIRSPAQGAILPDVSALASERLLVSKTAPGGLIFNVTSLPANENATLA